MADIREDWSLAPLVAHARATLEAGGVGEAGLEARILVEHFTATTRADSVLYPARPIAVEASDAVAAALLRRLGGEPVHRIVGTREFYGMRLHLSAATLEPRPDTESLVDLALPVARAMADRDGHCEVLDLGTGTGAVGLALLMEEPRARAVLTDISREALVTAAANANVLGMSGRVTMVFSDWFDGVVGRFHLIVSNPPYIESEVIASLEPEVRDHDPRAALDGGPDGLDAYRMIAAGARDHLLAGGRVVVEIGLGQRERVETIFLDHGFRPRDVMRDLGRRDRALLFAIAGEA